MHFFSLSLEMNAQAREGFRSARPNFEYGKDGPDFIYKFVMPMFTKEYRFHLGEPYDSMGVDGRPVKVRHCLLLLLLLLLLYYYCYYYYYYYYNYYYCCCCCCCCYYYYYYYYYYY